MNAFTLLLVLIALTLVIWLLIREMAHDKPPHPEHPPHPDKKKKVFVWVFVRQSREKIPPACEVKKPTMTWGKPK